MASGSKRAAPISRAENIERWIKNATPATHRRILAEVARIEAMEAKHGVRYDGHPAPEKHP